MSASTPSPDRDTYILPWLRPLYAALHEISETILRVIAGITLMVHGWPKIQNPAGMADMVAGIGFHPGWFWSSALATTEFVGGLLLVIGLLTRPVAAAATFLLLVTVWFHWVILEEGFSGAELSLIWAAVAFFFFVRGGNRHSIDYRLGKQF